MYPGEPNMNVKFTKKEIKFLVYLIGSQILGVAIGVIFFT